MKYSTLAEIGVLGVLNERGTSPVGEIQDVLQHNFSRYYGFSNGVVIPTVRELEERGDVVSSDKGGNKYFYRITDSGQARLQELLLDGLIGEDAVEVYNYQYVLVHLGFLHHLPEHDQANVLTGLEEALRERREKWTDVKRAHVHADTDAETGYRRAIFGLNVRLIDVVLEWLEEIEIRTLDAAAASDTANTGAREST